MAGHLIVLRWIRDGDDWVLAGRTVTALDPSRPEHGWFVARDARRAAAVADPDPDQLDPEQRPR